MGGLHQEIEPTVELAMIDARNQSLRYGANRLVYVDTSYMGYFGDVYIGIKSELYQCEVSEASATGHIVSQSAISAKSKAAKAAADSAAQAAMMHAQQMASQQAMHQAHMNAVNNAISNMPDF